MLRRVENVSLHFKKGLFTGRGWVTVVVGRNAYRTVKIHLNDYRDLMRYQQDWPVCVLTVNERAYWYFRDQFHWDNDRLTQEQVHALLVTRQQRNQGRIERAQAIVSMGAVPQQQANRREFIPDDVKQFVFTRDGGRCRHCGQQSELQFDHVIPVARGGSSNPENLQILCGPCNRRKGQGLTVR